MRFIINITFLILLLCGSHHPLFAITFIAVFCVLPSCLIDTPSALNGPNAFNSREDPNPRNGYCKLALQGQRFLGERQEIQSTALSLMFLADFAIPAALTLT